MSLFTKLGNEIASPVDAAGNPRAVENVDMQRWMTEVEHATLAFQAGGGIIFPDLATANASLAYAQNQMAWVIGDPVPANNGVYRKIGASGSGSWARLGDLPISMIRLDNAGAGTADAIIAEPMLPLPTTPGAALLTVNILAANTGSVTLNGKPLRTNSGNEIAPGGLTAGSIHAFLDLGDHFRLLSDQASDAIVAAAEAAQAAAEAAAAGINLPALTSSKKYQSLRVKSDGGGYDLVSLPGFASESELAGATIAAGESRVLVAGQPWEKLYYDHPAFGASVVTNGDMSSSTGWTLQSGFSIGSNLLTKTAGTANVAYQTNKLTISKKYWVRTVYDTIAASTFRAIVGGADGAIRAAAGTYDEVLTATSSATVAIAAVTTTSAGEISLFDVREMPPLAVQSADGSWWVPEAAPKMARVNRLLRDNFYDELSSNWYCEDDPDIDQSDRLDDWINAIAHGGKAILSPFIHSTMRPIRIFKPMIMEGAARHDGNMRNAGSATFSGSWLRMHDDADFDDGDSVLEILHENLNVNGATVRAFFTGRRFGIDGNFLETSNGNCLGVYSRNSIFEGVVLQRAPRDCLYQGDHPDFSLITAAASSNQYRDLWCGYANRNAVTLEGGDCIFNGGSIHQAYEAAMYINRGNVAVNGTYTWWSRDGVVIGTDSGAGIISLTGMLNRDHARAGLLVLDTGSMEEYGIQITGGIYAGGNTGLWPHLPGSPTYSEDYRAGIVVEGDARGIGIGGISVGLLQTSPVNGNFYGISVLHEDAVIDFQDVPMAWGQTHKVFNLAGYKNIFNGNNRAQAAAVDGVLSVAFERFEISGSAANISSIVLSNVAKAKRRGQLYNASANNQTLVHNATTLRCPGATNYVMAPGVTVDWWADTSGNIRIVGPVV